MKIVFLGNGNRGVSCLQALHDSGCDICLAVAHPPSQGQWYASVAELAEKLGIECIRPEKLDDRETAEKLKSCNAGVFVAAGYGMILKQSTIEIPKIMAINLHAGKLPEYRGSSPMNWSLINGESSFTLSIIRLDSGVDTGDVIMDKTFPIGPDDTIRDLHKIATEEYPPMLLEVLKSIEKGTYTLRKQDDSIAGYYPLRFPEDGLVAWDVLTAQQVHNRVRALTEPYPCAFTYYKGRKVKLLSSELSNNNYFGEPGRIYQKTNKGLLVCAAERCLWITKAVFDDSGESLADTMRRYDKFATLRDSLMP